MAWNPSARQLGGLKVLLFALALLPLARIVWMVASGQVVEPVEFITRATGDWTLYFLCLGLAVTPLRRLSKMNWLIKLRRMLGLFTFFYALLHFATFLWFDHALDLAAMWKDVLKRPFITVGTLAFVLLIPLAVTSTNAMQRRLGGKAWQWLHRLVYLIAPLAILHFWWMKAGKNNFTEPLIVGAVLALLLGLRLYWRVRRAPAELAGAGAGAAGCAGVGGAGFFGMYRGPGWPQPASAARVAHRAAAPMERAREDFTFKITVLPS